jgi:hypothetical protein
VTALPLLPDDVIGLIRYLREHTCQQPRERRRPVGPGQALTQCAGWA